VPKYFSLAPIFHALADPTRRTVIERLAQRNATVSELASAFSMALPSFMQHLTVLEDAGLVRSSKSGRTRTYALEPEALQALEDWLTAQRQVWERRLDQLDQYVSTLKEDTLNQSHTANPTPESKQGD
jgi:DNA-binding transcriptional ArsR family regulator